MSSLTASSSLNMDMISRLMLAGQVKLVGATSLQYASNLTQTIPSITIPALTGSQIAIIYLELSAENVSTAYASTILTAAGTGVNVGVNLAPNIQNPGGAPIAASQYFRNSAFGTTTVAGTVTFSSSTTSSSTYVTAQATVFIYTPPF
jgi:multidrug transporter EmrE-like cation transporter